MTTNKKNKDNKNNHATKRKIHIKILPMSLRPTFHASCSKSFGSDLVMNLDWVLQILPTGSLVSGKTQPFRGSKRILSKRPHYQQHCFAFVRKLRFRKSKDVFSLLIFYRSNL